MNTKGEPICKLWTLGDFDVSIMRIQETCHYAIPKEPKALAFFSLPFRVLCFIGLGFNGRNRGKYVHFIFLKVEILQNFIFIATLSISRMNDEGDFPGGSTG